MDQFNAVVSLLKSHETRGVCQGNMFEISKATFSSAVTPQGSLCCYMTEQLL